ncbi:Peroxiredoxin Q, chloroplastic [Sesamum alatum]|uniref:Peroxiredoxin Q, chloroplastic n=1 Tax=Sesamum alatum TaxID=300844 RepID=A0AAE1YFA8_9LAMI|nr:Peroxiredoxin Q, chloroplastic [Sesamum alatum]
MASISLHSNHTLPSLLHYAQTPKPTIPHNLSLLPKSSQSQFHGLKLSNSSHLAIPSSASVRTSIVAKVTEGTMPPAFTLKDQNGRPVSLSKFKGKPVVACAFRDSYEKFKKAGAEVIGISGDGTESHKAFAQKYKLPFTLLSDEGNKIRKEWASHQTYLVHYREGRLMFSTRMAFVDLYTTISSNPKSISMRP